MHKRGTSVGWAFIGVVSGRQTIPSVMQRKPSVPGRNVLDAHLLNAVISLSGAVALCLSPCIAVSQQTAAAFDSRHARLQSSSWYQCAIIITTPLSRAFARAFASVRQSNRRPLCERYTQRFPTPYGTQSRKVQSAKELAATQSSSCALADAVRDLLVPARARKNKH